MARCRRCRSRGLLALAIVALSDVSGAGAAGGEPAWHSLTDVPEGLVLRAGGFVQVDAGLRRRDSVDQLDSSTGRPLNEERFSIRRAHLRLDGRYRFVEGAIELEGTTSVTPTVRLFDAELSARWPWDKEGPPLVMLTMGLLRTPFGAVTPQRDVERLFLERGAGQRALFPGATDLGARLQGGYRVLRWQVALMNGHPTGERAFPQLDPTSRKDLVGRLGIETSVRRSARVAVGASGLWGTGFHAGSPGTKDGIDWRDDNGDGVVQPSELHPVLGVAATPSLSFERFALGIDGRLEVEIPRLGPLALAGELVWAKNLDRGLYVADPIAAGRDLRELAFEVGVTQALSPWVLVGLRYDRYDPDADARAQLGARSVPVDRALSTWAVAVAVQRPPWARLVLEYDRNNNALAIDDAGRPATLDSDALTLRAQLSL